MAKGKSQGAGSGPMVKAAGRVQEVLTADGLLAVLGLLPFDSIPIALSVRWLWNPKAAEDPVKAVMDPAWAEANAAWASAASLIADAAQAVMEPMADSLNDDRAPALAAMNLALAAFQQQTGADAAQGAQSAMDALSPLIGILTEPGALRGWVRMGFAEGLTAGLQENAGIGKRVAASAPLWGQVFDRERMGGAIDRLGDRLSALGADLAAGLIAGISSAAPDFGPALAPLIPFGRRAREAPAPRRVAERALGVPMAEGMVEGMASMSAQMANVLDPPARVAAGAGRTGSPIVVNQYFELADKSEQSLARAARRGAEQSLVTVWRRRGERA